MNIAAPVADVPVAVDPRLSARPIWRSYGGGGLILGGVVLLAATLVEWAYGAGEGKDGVLGMTYGIAFLVALVVLAAATLPLALGTTGRDGIVRGSTLGRIGLIGYGVAFLGAQIAYLYMSFTTVDASAVNLVLSIVQTLCAILAVVAIVRARVVSGVARWSFLVSVVIGVVAGISSNAGAPFEAVMIGFCISAASIAFVGATYLFSAEARSATAR